MRQADVYMHNVLAGRLAETAVGYAFTYDGAYLQAPGATPVSLTLPLIARPYTSAVMFPFFDGLVPEGWLLDMVTQNWKVDRRDRMGLLLACCKDCIGAVSIVPAPNRTDL